VWFTANPAKPSFLRAQDRKLPDNQNLAWLKLQPRPIVCRRIFVVHLHRRLIDEESKIQQILWKDDVGNLDKLKRSANAPLSFDVGSKHRSEYWRPAFSLGSG